MLYVLAFILINGSGLCCVITIRKMAMLATRSQLWWAIGTLGVYAYFWGWLHVRRHVSLRFMLLWSLCVLGVVGALAIK